MKRSFKAAAVALVGVALSAAPFGAVTPASAETRYYGPSKGKNSVRDRFLVRFPKSYAPGQIIVSFTDRRLYHVFVRGNAVSYPIAVPRPESRWEGIERVSIKKVEPSWTPTQEMRAENPELPAKVLGGDPKNPMGARALYLGNTLYRIHGTDAPWTIGRNVSRGCVRMHNQHVMELFENVRIGSRVIATYDSFKLKRLADQIPQFPGEFYWFDN